jgi:hypothetical protein
MTAAVVACQAAGANIINMSITGQNSSDEEAAAMQAAYDAGILLIGAAGNTGNNILHYPAAYDAVIAVGAVDSNSSAWMYTQTNAKVELVAPGVAVDSTVLGNSYDIWDGSGMATAYVSGIAALVWSQHSDCSNDEIRDALRRSAQDQGDPGRDDLFGHGIVQAKAASDLLTSENCTDNIPNEVEVVDDPVVFSETNNTETVPYDPADITPDTWVNQGSTGGLSCSSTGGFRFQSSNGRVALQSGSATFNFDLGVRSFGFNCYGQGSNATVTITTASGKTNVINLTEDGYVGITSDEDIVSIAFDGAPGFEIGDLSRSSSNAGNNNNGVSGYSDADDFAALGSTSMIDDIENATNKDQWFSQIDSTALSCVSNNNVGIASVDSTDFAISPTTASIITSNGDQDFTINFNFPPNRISFNTHLNQYGPAIVTVTTLNDSGDANQEADESQFTINHGADVVGFFGLNSVQKIQSVRWHSANGSLVKTGISNLQADVIDSQVIYQNLAQFEQRGTTTIVEDFESWSPKNTALSSYTNVGINWTAETNVGTYRSSFTPTPASHVLTSWGDEIFTMHFTSPVTSVGMDTYLNQYGPATITIIYADGSVETATHSHNISQVGFWGIHASKVIASIKWQTVKGGVVNTGIDNIRINAAAAVVGFDDLSWTLPSNHPDQDSCGGARQANFDPNVYFVRANTLTPVSNLEVPSGYRWITKIEHTNLFNASTVASKNNAILQYYGQCGLSTYPRLNGNNQIVFLYKEGGISGSHSSNYERSGADLTAQDHTGNLAGYILYKDIGDS